MNQGFSMRFVWNLYGFCMELVWNLYGTTRLQRAIIPQAPRLRQGRHKGFPPAYLEKDTEPCAHELGYSPDAAFLHPRGTCSWLSLTPSRRANVASTLRTNICVSAGRCVAMASKVFALCRCRSFSTVPSPAL